MTFFPSSDPSKWGLLEGGLESLLSEVSHCQPPPPKTNSGNHLREDRVLAREDGKERASLKQRWQILFYLTGERKLGQLSSTKETSC